MVNKAVFNKIILVFHVLHCLEEGNICHRCQWLYRLRVHGVHKNNGQWTSARNKPIQPGNMAQNLENNLISTCYYHINAGRHQ